MTQRLHTRGLRAPALVTMVALGACSAGEPGLARGAALYDTCVPCHGDVGQGNRELGAPPIAGLPQWYIEGQLQSFTQNWRGAHPMDTVGIRMKSMVQALDLEGDLESVAEYVAGLPRVMAAQTIEGGSVQAGQNIYQGLCVACHGPEGLGNEALHAPPLVGQPDWYLARQIQKFRMRWRGGSPEDIWGTTMQVNSLLYDDDQIRDALAYIQTLQ